MRQTLPNYKNRWIEPNMNTQTLRKRQTPLKKNYQNNPEEALKTLKAEGTLGDNITCRVKTQNGPVTSGLHPATGGDGTAVCSGDMLLESLAACAGVTLNAVATNMGIELEDATVRAEGELDFRGTLGVSKDAPVGFKDIRLHFELTSDENDSKLQKLIDLTERYCVIYQTLTDGVSIQTSYSS
jgi:uncharacterized OsmC-like protein